MFSLCEANPTCSSDKWMKASFALVGNIFIIRQFGINELYRLGTCRIYACGDNSSGLDANSNETMSLKQETESPLGDPICSSDKW